MTQSIGRPGRAELAALRWLAEAGADEAVEEAPLNRFRPTLARRLAGAVAPSAPAVASSVPLRAASPAPPPIAVSPGATDAIARAIETAAACMSLLELKTALESFDGCTLKQHASRTVFAEGTPAHGILVIGEAPGREEDAAGLPFVGRAGKLLDLMLAAIGLDRRTNVYITNVVNWRPPANRDPTPEEVAVCRPFLRRHIELAAPEIILLFGAVAVRHVMGKSEGIMRLRGTWLEYHAGGRMVPVMPTLHPAYLLRRPSEKRLAWRDLQAAEARIRTLGLLERAPAPG